MHVSSGAKDKKKSITPLPVECANGTIMWSTHEGELYLPMLPPAARKIHLFPKLKNDSLLSIGQLCEAGCSAHFYDTHVFIDYQGETVLVGQRNGPFGLWRLNLTPNALNTPSTAHSHRANVARPAFLPASTKIADVIEFYHAALFAPAISTLQKALDFGYVHGFPGLDSASIRRHTPFSVATVRGHQDHIRQNIQSTKPVASKPSAVTRSYVEAATPSPQPTATIQELEDIPFPVSDEPNARTHLCYTSIETISGKIFGDLTGAFPVPSRAGNLYHLVVYDYDSNYIDAEPLKSRSGPTILAGYKRIIERLKKAGLQPRFQRLDNEASQQLKDYLRSENINFQLAPPGEHKRNIAERCIRTWKNHFIAGLECCDTAFPASLWDYLLPQARITLNLLRGSRINPKLLA